MEWKDLYQQWRSLMAGADILLNPLFTVIWVCDTSAPKGDRTQFDWWGLDQISQYYRWLNGGQSGSIEIKQRYKWKKGELTTLEYLWEAEDNLEQIAITLIAATLFPLIQSSRTQHCHTPALETITKIIYFDKEVSVRGWVHNCTSVLPGPYMNEPGPWVNIENSYERSDSVEATLEKISRQHWHLLHYYRPVAIRTQIFDEESLRWVCDEQVDELVAKASRQRMSKVLSWSSKATNLL